MTFNVGDNCKGGEIAIVNQEDLRCDGLFRKH